jgi:hypothetical protein
MGLPAYHEESTMRVRHVRLRLWILAILSIEIKLRMGYHK